MLPLIVLNYLLSSVLTPEACTAGDCASTTALPMTFRCNGKEVGLNEIKERVSELYDLLKTNDQSIGWKIRFGSLFYRVYSEFGSIQDCSFRYEKVTANTLHNVTLSYDSSQNFEVSYKRTLA